ncbi:MAG TPA: ribbon-helix-helix domain-containing protein [Friedmanniella sp.]
MKISVSLPTVDVELLDSYANTHAFASRSAALQHAIDLLRHAELADAYEEAWDEWDSSGEAQLWEAVVADGLRPT